MAKNTMQGDLMRQENPSHYSSHRKTFCFKGNWSESHEKTKELDPEAEGLVLFLCNGTI